MPDDKTDEKASNDQPAETSPDADTGGAAEAASTPAPTATEKPAEKPARGERAGKKKPRREGAAEAEGQAAEPAVTADPPGAAPPLAGSGKGEGAVPPAAVVVAPRFKPARPRLRDWLLTLVPLAGVAGLMLFRGDVRNPRGEDPQHPLGHVQTLLHSGHVPGGIIIGFLLLLVATVGILGLMGDSPLDLRGDEVVPTPEQRRPFWKREGAWLVTFCVLLYAPMAGAYGLWDPWETHYSEVAREMLARDDWITLWWGQEGWFMSKPILIFYIGALGMGAGSAFGLPFWRDMGPGSHEWFIRLPIVFFAIGAVYAVYRAVAFAFGRRAGLLCGLVLATMPHWFFLAHQAMTDMPFVAPLVVAMCFLMLAVSLDPEHTVKARAVRLFGRTFRVSHWHLAVAAIVMVALPQILYLLTRPMMIACPDGAEHDACRNVLAASRLGSIQFPIEQYWSGSAGNSVYRDAAATIPGSPPWEERYNQIAFMTSFVQGIIWLALGVLLMLTFRKERRAQPLAFMMMYLFGAISFMGKGPAGLGVPEITLLGFMITTGKWKTLTRWRFFQGVTLFALCGMPWYIAIYCRLGNEFFDRFVVHDLLNRAFAGVHGDTGTFRYFVWQLGYAMFPWTGLAAAALAGWRLLIPPDATEAQKDTIRVALLWVIVSFTLFSMMVTKFHHYIFPMVPGTALLVGLLLYRMGGGRLLKMTQQGFGSLVAAVGGVALTVVGLTSFFGQWHGQMPHTYTGPEPCPPGPPHRAVAVTLVLLGVAALVGSWMLAQRSEGPDPENEPVKPPDLSQDGLGGTYREAPTGADKSPRGVGTIESVSARTIAVAMGAVGVGAAVLLGLVARDIGFVQRDQYCRVTGRPAGFERFMHLFTYNYDRPFPNRSYDYHALLTGFGIAAVAFAVLIAISRTRRFGVRLMVALATCFTFWGVNKYMIDLSNHWSQRNLFVRYQQLRRQRESVGVGEDGRYWSDPLAAYQMNWKGENFYTGNHAAMLECGLPLCHERTNDWLRRHQGQRIFIVTEHSRSGSILGQVRSAGGTGQAVTTEYDNNKFVLIEAQL